MTRRGTMMIQPSPSVEFFQHPPIYIYREVTIGKRLVILAEAEDGDLYNPILVYNKDMARDLFKSGALLQAYEDACTYQDNLYAYLMRIEPYMYELAFSVLESFDFDLMFIHEVHYDIQREVIDQFISFAQSKEEMGSLVHGITTLSAKKQYADVVSLFESIASFTIEVGDDVIETGKYLSIVLNQSGIKDAGAVYAGILAALDPEVSPINKTIPNFTLAFELEKEEIVALRNAGIVCFKSTYKKGVTCTSSSCAVKTEGSVHKHISNFRIAQFLINEVASELQPFIGKPSNSFQLDTIDELIDAICLEHMELERIRDYAYELSIEQVKGFIYVNIEIVPIFSVHSIPTHTRVRVFK